LRRALASSGFPRGVAARVKVTVKSSQLSFYSRLG
jgi:hypothetical protein